MTREQAVAKLELALHNNAIEDVESAYEYIKAIKMAIKALQVLEQVEQIIKDTEEIVNDSGESTYTQKCAMLRAYEEIVDLIGGKE